MTQHSSGRCFGNFAAGQVFGRPHGRSVTQSDNIWFTPLTNNSNPLHHAAHHTAHYAAHLNDGSRGQMTGRQRSKPSHKLAQRLARGADLLRERRGQRRMRPDWYEYYAGVADKLRGETIPSAWVSAYRAVSGNAPFGGFKYGGTECENALEAVLEHTDTETVWTELTGAIRDPFTVS